MASERCACGCHDPVHGFKGCSCCAPAPAPGKFEVYWLNGTAINLNGGPIDLRAYPEMRRDLREAVNLRNEIAALRAEVEEWRKAEKETSNAYLRLRRILDALRTQPGEDHFAHTEEKARVLRAEVERLRAAEENREKAIRAAWDDESRVGIEAIAAWVRKERARCAKKGGIFDTIFRCESDGGEWFLFDPETLTDALAERDRWRRAVAALAWRAGVLKLDDSELILLPEDGRIVEYRDEENRSTIIKYVAAAALKREEGK